MQYLSIPRKMLFESAIPFLKVFSKDRSEQNLQPLAFDEWVGFGVRGQMGNLNVQQQRKVG